MDPAVSATALALDGPSPWLLALLGTLLAAFVAAYKLGLVYQLRYQVNTQSPRHGGESVAEVLKAHGVRHVFTLVGGHISPILVASEKLGIRVVDTRHEATAVFAADAMARLSAHISYYCGTWYEMDSKLSQHKHFESDELSCMPKKEKGQNGDEQIVAEIMGRRFSPSLITTRAWERFHFVGREIEITETTDSYGAVVWPSALVLCHFLEMNVNSYSMADKNVIEIGAGTGLVSIVASFLGAHVTATDLPELLGNLQYNVFRNTKMRCKWQPQVKELFWGADLEEKFPKSSCQFDYILAADVVYHHPYLDELLLTFDHLCIDNTIILWAMRFRLEKENQFVDRFQKLFDLEVISDFPSLNITLFKAKRRRRVKCSPIGC